VTFGALAAWQAWLLVGGAAALAAAMFFIKLRPPRILVPSLSLWQRVLEASPDVTRWERIRRAISLILTVAVAMLLAFAVARPARSAGSGTAAGGRVLVVIDSSWSMLARTRSGDTRWERALAEARRIAAASDRIAIATTADGLVEGLTDDAVLIEAALGRITPSEADAGAWPAVGGVDAVHFITDGASLRPLDRAVVVHSVFDPVPNVAITAFDVRSLIGSDRRAPASQIAEAYLEVANFAPAAQQVRITLLRGNATVAEDRVEIAAGEAYRQVLPIPRAGDPALRARVQAPQNAVDADDESYAWIDRAQRLSTVVVGEHTEWLRRLLSADPDVRATFVVPSDYRGAGPEDVTIFDRWAPEAAPARPALYVSPPAETPWLSAESGVTAAEERKPRWDAAGSHQVLRGVDPQTMRIERVRGYSSAGLIPAARSTRGTPIVSVHESPERRFVVVGFGPAESNLALAPGFPVLVGNALEWLAHPELKTRSLQPGMVAFSTTTARVSGPGGTSVPLTRIGGEAVGLFRAPGLYVAEGGGARSTFAVNIADPGRSNLAHTNLQGGSTPAPARGLFERQWWLGCAIAAFALALGEWWTWQRRVTV
jgi:Ca-activated chloride channel homolog